MVWVCSKGYIFIGKRGVYKLNITCLKLPFYEQQESYDPIVNNLSTSFTQSTTAPILFSFFYRKPASIEFRKNKMRLTKKNKRQILEIKMIYKQK